MSFPTGDDVPQVGIDEISAALSLGVKLLDVREDDEWGGPGTSRARNIYRSAMCPPEWTSSTRMRRYG
ncbi:putative rhodanese domain protein [Mycobacteroides abscessus 1948]|uniref:Putative rhodanese domain protein n=1 Tax=Mycobacteroides abscessus 1948 TaxID=1299323 RepID=A0A829QMI8_9MYCO|nr:putative rhodanese domain protein [Mycobacteroides abscessus 1948]